MQRGIFTALFLSMAIGAFAQFRVHDTLFLKRTWLYPDSVGYHRIFFQPRYDSGLYKNIRDFSFADSLHGFRPDLPHKWRRIYSFGNKMVAYHSSDGGAEYKMAFSNKTLIEFYWEAYVSAVKTFTKVSEKVFSLKLKGEDGKNSLLTIYVIDAEKRIAIFKTITGSEKSYELMMDDSKINALPLIVNYCDTDRVTELEFDKIDFEKLLSKYKFHKH